MQSSINLPGLERLIAVCRAHGLPAERYTPPDKAPLLKDTLFGQPVDPVLREQISRFNMRHMGDLFLYSLDSIDGIESFNERLRDIRAELLEDVHLYAGFDGFPYYLATVPSLAGSHGIQPVVFVILDIERKVMPIASSVDRAFDLYARYLEVLAARNASLVERYGSVKAGRMREGGFHFPRSIPQLVAEDRQLVEMLEAHRFDAFTSVDPDMTEWNTNVLRATRDRG